MALHPADGSQHVHHVEDGVAEKRLRTLLRAPVVAISKGLEIRRNGLCLIRLRQSEPHQGRLLVFVQQPGRRRMAGIEWVLGEQSQTETVDGGYEGLIELERIFDPARRKKLHPNALAKLRSRCLGKGHRHDALRCDRAVGDPPRETSLYVIGFARACARRYDTERWDAHSITPASSSIEKRSMSGLFSIA